MTSKFNLLFKRPLFVAIKVNLLSSFQFCKKIPNLVDFVLQVTVSRKIIEYKFVYLTTRQGFVFIQSFKYQVATEFITKSLSFRIFYFLAG